MNSYTLTNNLSKQAFYYPPAEKMRKRGTNCAGRKQVSWGWMEAAGLGDCTPEPLPPDRRHS